MGIFNKAMTGLIATDNVSRSSKLYSPNNKYDDVMGTEIPKMSKSLGTQNVAINKGIRLASASDELNEKLAALNAKDIKKRVSRKFDSFDTISETRNVFNTKKYIGRMKRDLDHKNYRRAAVHLGRSAKSAGKAMLHTIPTALDKENTKHILNTKKYVGEIGKNLNNKNMRGAAESLGRAAKSGGKAALFTVPVAALGAGAAIGTGKAIDKLSKANKDPRNNNNINDFFPQAVTGVLMAAGTANALAHKSALAPFKESGRAIKKVVMDHPTKMINKHFGRTGQMATNMFYSAKKASDEVKKSAGKTNFHKRASDEIDELLKTAGLDRNFAKSVFKKDVLEAGVTTIPYYAAPAGIMYATSKAKEKHEKDIPKEQVILTLPIQKTANETLGQELIRRTVQGTTRGIIPAAIIAGTGRNIKGSLEKVNDKPDISVKKVDGNKAEVTITMPKRASWEIDDLYMDKIAVDQSLLETNQKDISEISGEAPDKINTSKVNLRSGVKKEMRMEA